MIKDIIAHARDAPNSSETPVNIDPAAGTCAQRVDTARGNLAPLAARFASASRHDVPATASALRLGCANFAAPQRNRPGTCPAPRNEDLAAVDQVGPAGVFEQNVAFRIAGKMV